MRCPTCGGYSLDFQADRFICTSCGAVFPPSKMLELLNPIEGWMKGSPLDGSNMPPRGLREDGSTDGPGAGDGAGDNTDGSGVVNLVSDLSSLTWQFLGESLAPNVERIRNYGERFDELDAGNNNRMREYLGRGIREQFDFDLQTIACRMALLNGNVLPEELALINGALGLNLDETALRACAQAAPNTTDSFFNVSPKSFVAAVVYDNYFFGIGRAHV